MGTRSFNPATDAETVARLLAGSFGGTVSRRQVRALRSTKPGECDYRRVVEDDGAVVAYLEIVPREIYVGRALFTVGGIAGVCTDPARRMKGYGRTLMEHAVTWVRDRKFDICLLYGIPNYYHKFGFEVVMARHFVTCAQTDVPALNWGVKTKRVKKRDMPAVRDFYNRYTRYHDGNCRRRAMRLPEEALRVVDASGRMESYASWSRADATLVVREAIARDVRAATDLVQALRVVSWREGLGQINVQMPFGYPVTDVLAGYSASYHRVNTFRAGCMGQVSNLAPVVRKMTAEWAARLKASRFAARAGRLALGVGPDTLLFDWSGGTLKVTIAAAKSISKTTPQRFAQMVFGYRSIASLSSESDVKFAGRDRRLLEVLFPERASFLMTSDHF